MAGARGVARRWFRLHCSCGGAWTWHGPHLEGKFLARLWRDAHAGHTVTEGEE